MSTLSPRIGSRRASVSDPSLSIQIKKRTGWNDLPTELKTIVARNLPLKGLLSLQSVDKGTKEIADEHVQRLRDQFQTEKAHIDSSTNVIELHSAVERLVAHKNKIPFLDIANKISNKLLDDIKNKAPREDRAQALALCMKMYAGMESSELRAKGLGRTAGIIRCVAPAHYQKSFELVLHHMETTIPERERDCVLTALIYVTVPPDYDGSDTSRERVVANVITVISNTTHASKETRNEICGFAGALATKLSGDAQERIKAEIDANK